jgi:hypothetical protein
MSPPYSLVKIQGNHGRFQKREDISWEGCEIHRDLRKKKNSKVLSGPENSASKDTVQEGTAQGKEVSRMKNIQFWLLGMANIVVHFSFSTTQPDITNQLRHSFTTQSDITSQSPHSLTTQPDSNSQSWYPAPPSPDSTSYSRKSPLTPRKTWNKCAYYL